MNFALASSIGRVGEDQIFIAMNDAVHHVFRGNRRADKLQTMDLADNKKVFELPTRHTWVCRHLQMSHRHGRRCNSSSISDHRSAMFPLMLCLLFLHFSIFGMHAQKHSYRSLTTTVRMILRYHAFDHGSSVQRPPQAPPCWTGTTACFVQRVMASAAASGSGEPPASGHASSAGSGTASAAAHTSVQTLAHAMSALRGAGGINLGSVNASIANMRREQARVREERKRLAKEMRNAQRRKKRLKTKARQLSNDDLLAVLLMREEASADTAESTTEPSSGSASSSPALPPVVADRDQVPDQEGL